MTHNNLQQSLPLFFFLSICLFLTTQQLYQRTCFPWAIWIFSIKQKGWVTIQQTAGSLKLPLWLPGHQRSSQMKNCIQNVSPVLRLSKWRWDICIWIQNVVKFFLVFLIQPFSVCQPLAIINLWEIIVPLPLGFQAQLVAVVLYVRLLLQSLVHLKGKKMFQGWWWAGYLQRILSARVWCAACVISLYHTVPSASSEELQVNRVAAFLWLGRWLNNFSLKNRVPLQQWLRDTHWGKTLVVSANWRDPTPRVLQGATGATHPSKLCWGTETSPLTTQNLK